MKIGVGAQREVPALTRSTAEGTRDAVTRLILELGPQTAAALARHLGLSAAAIRRHLDALLADGLVTESAPRMVAGRRGRGRPARRYALTETGRAAFPHGYDELAVAALHYLRDHGGEHAVTAFAAQRAQTLADGMAPRIHDADGARQRTEQLAEALTAHGFAATTQDALSGVQLCQHHCPVAQVAAQFPELCEAETRAFEQLLGTNLQRLATIAHGDGVCTTHVPTESIPIRTQISARSSR